MITPDQFRTAFKEVMAREHPRLCETWESNKQFTASMLDKRTGVIVEVAKTLGINCCMAYWDVDAIYFREKDEVHFRASQIYARRISVAIEQENNWRTSDEEMNKLCQWNTPLAVLITYPPKRAHAGVLARYSAIARDADFFHDFSNARRKMVIFGSRKGADISWDCFQFDGKSFNTMA